MSSLLISFDDEYYKSLLSLFAEAVKRQRIICASGTASDIKREIELEFRIGIPKYFNRKDGKWTFSPNLDQADFERVKSALDRSNLYTQEYEVSTVEIKSYLDNNGLEVKVRKIVTVKEEERIVEWQTKTNLSHPEDQLFISSPLQAVGNDRNIYMLRCALSEESSANDSENNALEARFRNLREQPVIRNRQRYTYSTSSHKIDLTIVDNTYTIELEYAKEKLEAVNTNRLADGKYMFAEVFFPPLKSLLAVLFPKLRVAFGINSLPKYYAQMLDISAQDKRVTEPQPRNIKEAEVPDLLSGYSWTNKLNGSRFRILLGRFKFFQTNVLAVFLVSSTNARLVCLEKDGVNAIEQRLPMRSDRQLEMYKDMVVDIELFEYDGKLGMHAFDCPVWKGINNTIKSHDERIKPLYDETFANTLNSLLRAHGYFFEVKTFFYKGPQNMIEDLKAAVRYMYNRYGKDVEEANDGLIMTPVGTYKTRENKVRVKAYYDRTFPAFKWKFPNTVSIDFKLQEKERYKDQNKINHKVFTLLVRDEGNTLIPFRSFSRGKMFYPPTVIDIGEGSESFNLLQTGQVVELGFNDQTNSFTVFRIRIDKVDPNTRVVAEDTFVDMVVKFTLDKLSMLVNQAVFEAGYGSIVQKISQSKAESLKPVVAGVDCTKGMEEYRKFNNKIKGNIINKWCRNKRVLDLGTGKFGDIHKYRAANIEFLWAVEPNSKHINDPGGFMTRLKMQPEDFRNKVELIETGAQDRKLITESMMKTLDQAKARKIVLESSLANVVTAFYSATFFFQTDEMLESVVQTVANNLETDGYFVGTVMDGDNVYEKLKEKNGRINSNCFYIQQYYESTKPFGTGLEIGINLGNTPTVQGEQREWLVFWEVFKNKLASYNIVPVETLFLNDFKLSKMLGDKEIETDIERLSQDNKDLNSLYRYFAFKKVGTDATTRRTEREKAALETRIKNSLPPISEIDEMVSEQILDPVVYQEKLYRVGVIGDGSCLYHSILYCLIPSRYTSLSIGDRKELAATLRNSLADALTLEMFASLADGAVESVGITPYLLTELTNALYTGVIEQKETPSISKNNIDKMVSDTSHLQTMELKIIYIQNALQPLGYAEEDITEIINSARFRQLNLFKENLRNCSTWADHVSMEYLMRKLGINLFIVTDGSRLPITFCDCSLYNASKDSIVVLNLEGLSGHAAHFEPVCRLVNEGEGFYQTTKFAWNDGLVKSLYSLC